MTELEILDYRPEWRDAFARLNLEWLESRFTVESLDRELLGDPERSVLAGGGCILFARLDGAIVGTVALLRDAEGVYELGKMAVTRALQGRGIGRALLAAAIARFRARGGRTLFLESHSSLHAALALYRAMGFEQQPGRRPGSHYARSDVYMIWRDPDTARPRD